MTNFCHITPNLPAANLTCVTVAKDTKDVKDLKEIGGFYT